MIDWWKISESLRLFMAPRDDAMYTSLNVGESRDRNAITPSSGIDVLRISEDSFPVLR